MVFQIFNITSLNMYLQKFEIIRLASDKMKLNLVEIPLDLSHPVTAEDPESFSFPHYRSPSLHEEVGHWALTYSTVKRRSILILSSESEKIE